MVSFEEAVDGLLEVGYGEFTGANLVKELDEAYLLGRMEAVKVVNKWGGSYYPLEQVVKYVKDRYEN